jgi:HD-GYP domain-containing protein (c-di-GMP phosphodiesterase class II)
MNVRGGLSFPGIRPKLHVKSWAYLYLPRLDNMKVIVAPVDLQKGMYVSELDRPWLETPFLFQGFRITNNDELQQIDKLCDFVFVDTEKSTIPVPERAAINNGERSRETQQDTARIVRAAEPYRNTFDNELPAARDIHGYAMKTTGTLLNDVRMGKSLDVEETRRVVIRMVDSILRNPDALALLACLSKKHDALVAHALTVCTLSLCFGRYLGLDKATLVELGIGALVHDIGETKLPDRLLRDSNALSEEERALLQSHTRIGMMIMKKLEGVSETVIAIARDHHERADGSGYPRKLVNSELDVCTRIVSIVDTYDSITSGVHGREKIGLDVALKYIYSWREGLFDALLVEKFIQCIGVYPIGSTVELRSGHIGIVISSQPDARLFPRVMLVLDARKEPVEPPKTMNLALFREKGGDDTGYEVTRLINAQDYGIDVRSYVLRELGGT